jgi:hypothetical protein
MPDGRFAAILLPHQSGTWWWYYGLGGLNVAEVANLTGGRVVDVEQYTQGGEPRYAVVLTGSRGGADPAADEDVRETYPIEIVLTTTSDWTRVRFDGLEVEVRNQEILVGAEADGLDVEARSTLDVSQVCCDSTLVQARFRAHVSDPSEWLQMHVEKGHIGETTITLHVPGDPEPIGMYKHAGVVRNPDLDNTRTFWIHWPYLASHLTSVLASPLE